MTAAPSKTHVAVLKGGRSAEREVSLVSGAKCAEALRTAGFAVTEIDAGDDIAERLKETAPDVVFNALHGRWGEDGCVQGLLELLRLPYTHSGVTASAIAMEKEVAKRLLAPKGMPVAASLVLSVAEASAEHRMARPYVLKPVNEGSSVGVYIVREGDNRPPRGIASGMSSERVMIEEFVPGRELTVAVMNGDPLAVTEIAAPEGGFYDYEAKYSAGGSEHILPADIPGDVAAECLRLAALAHTELGCRGVTRTDFRWNDAKGRDGLVFLEINTQPGMTPTSLVPEQAQYKGISFPDLCKWMVEDASCPR